MKRICSLLLLGVFVLGTAVIFDWFSPGNHRRVYHHEIAAEAAFCENLPEGQFCSHLPLIFVDTNGAEVSQESEVLSDVRLLDHPGGHNHLGDPADLQVSALFKIRGNSSAWFDKHQYRVTYVDAKQWDGSSDPQLLPHISKKTMGMPAESEWVLNGPFLDRTLVRNYLMYNLSGEIMDWAPNVRFCEFFLNGSYEGVYLMVEAVKMDENRVHLEKLSKDRIGTGYLVQRERPGKTNYPLYNFGTYTGYTSSELGAAYPGPASGALPQHYEYVRQDIGAFERMLYSLDYDDLAVGYSQAIDVDSFVDYFILNEFSMNVDGGAYSTYAHKDVGGRLIMGPVWDFNNCFDNFQDYELPCEEFYLYEKNWYVMLCRDEIFTEKIIDRYRLLRQGPLSEENLYRIIDEAIAFLGPAISRNEARWQESYEKDWLTNKNMKLEELSYDRNLHSYEEAVRQLKNCIHARGEFLDQYIVALRQFSAESKVKEWN